ncbi:MAG: hypothetical protein ACREQA_17520 [Candidatus Binatia bacterium]
MKKPERKQWDPNCPKCQEELQRHIELSDSIFDEVNHGVGKGELLEDYYCNHQGEQEA